MAASSSSSSSSSSFPFPTEEEEVVSSGVAPGTPLPPGAASVLLPPPPPPSSPLPTEFQLTSSISSSCALVQELVLQLHVTCENLSRAAAAPHTAGSIYAEQGDSLQFQLFLLRADRTPLTHTDIVKFGIHATGPNFLFIDINREQMTLSLPPPPSVFVLQSEAGDLPFPIRFIYRVPTVFAHAMQFTDVFFWYRKAMCSYRIRFTAPPPPPTGLVCKN